MWQIHIIFNYKVCDEVLQFRHSISPFQLNIEMKVVKYIFENLKMEEKD